jgi:hypothetical protein
MEDIVRCRKKWLMASEIHVHNPVTGETEKEI